MKNELEDGYDDWFADSVIFPERRQYVRKNILGIATGPEKMNPEIIDKLSSDTIEKINKFYRSHTTNEQ